MSENVAMTARTFVLSSTQTKRKSAFRAGYSTTQIVAMTRLTAFPYRKPTIPREGYIKSSSPLKKRCHLVLSCHPNDPPGLAGWFQRGRLHDRTIGCLVMAIVMSLEQEQKCCTCSTYGLGGHELGVTKVSQSNRG
jgi:hypothetical protein